MKLIHSWRAISIIVVLFIGLLNFIISFYRKREFKKIDLRIAQIIFIGSLVQFFIGIITYIMSPWFNYFKTNATTVMNNREMRLLALEHPLSMFLAVILIAVGWFKHKKQLLSTNKFKILFIFYGLSLVIILSKIPWINWLN